MKKLWLVATVFMLWSISAKAAERLTYIDLINRLTDLEKLSVLPVEGEKCAQWSSYDRKSVYDASTGKYINWDANGDGSGFIREEGGQQVLAEMTGPGVIWRTWSAKPEAGHVKIYLDGSDTPAVDLPFSGFFDRKNEPFTGSALVHYSASGANCYVPIPYQKSCKITADKNWGAYYHFTYTTYPKGTVVPTFKRELTEAEKTALDRANQLLSNCGNDPAGTRLKEKSENKTITIAPGKTGTIINIGGPNRAITAIKVKVQNLPGTPKDRPILQGLVLRIKWDGESSPSVFTPLGDFFGTAPGANKYKSLPLGMTDEGFYCYWYMPFKKSAELELTNNGETEQTVSFQITHAPLNKSINSLGRFHARWHRDDDLDPAREIDWTMLKVSGRGRFVGVMLHVWNPRGNWWGEGDEKFFIDGEKFPSTIGTGSEDYFGYAWCNPTPFVNCYHNQTYNAGNNKGHVSVNRWHITDNEPFLKSFEGAIEKYYSNDRPTLYDCTAYWYQAEPHKSWQVSQEFPGKMGKYISLYLFFDKVKEYSGSNPIEPLRKMYNDLASDPDLASHKNEICLMMAKAEKTAGNEKEYQAIIQPVIEKLTRPFVDRDLADDIRAVLREHAPETENGNENVLLVSASVADQGGDGSAKRIEKGGRWCISTQGDSRPYIYFCLHDKTKFRRTDKTVNLRITYYSDGTSRNLFKVHYDSHYSDDLAGHYQDSKEIANSSAAGWQTVVVQCPRAKFAGGQNGEADFRISASGNGDVLISDIKAENP